MHNVIVSLRPAIRCLTVIIGVASLTVMLAQAAESAQPVPHVLPAGEPTGPAPDTVQFLTGKQFSDALLQRVSISWQERPLRAGLRQLSESREVAILLDRRVDPEQTLTLGLSKLSLQDILKTIATECRAGISIVGNTVYFGPAKTAAQLRTLVELRSRQLAGENAVVGTKRSFELLKRSTLRWQDVDRPSEIVAGLCREAGLKIESDSPIPHDLWAGATIPHATVTEKLLLIFAQFDLSFDWRAEGTSVRLTDMPENSTVDRTWQNLSQARRNRVSRILPQLRGLAHNLSGTRLTVNGTVEQLEEVDRLIYPERYANRTVPRPTGQGELKFTLEIRAQLGSLLKALPEKSDIQFEYDAAVLASAGVKLERGVDIKMKNASLRELCEALFKDSGIAWAITGRKVTLTPASK